MSESSDPEKKIIIDEDWKSQVQAEKDAAHPAEPEEPAASDTEGSQAEPMEFPPAAIGSIISMFASQALIAMGHIPHPASGKPEQNLEEAKFLIELLAVLEEKTKGNLDEEEQKMMTDMTHQLRMGFVATKGQAGE